MGNQKDEEVAVGIDGHQHGVTVPNIRCGQYPLCNFLENPVFSVVV